MGFVTNKYKHVPPVKQNHRNSCWAACLEFWVRAATGNRSITAKKLWKDEELIERYNSDSESGDVHSKSHDDYGVLEKSEILWLLRQPRWGMSAWEMAGVNGELISDLLANVPVYIGYFDTYSAGNHVNVICGYDAELDMVEAMEPRKGKFVERGLYMYTENSAMNIVGWKP